MICPKNDEFQRPAADAAAEKLEMLLYKGCVPRHDAPCSAAISCEESSSGIEATSEAPIQDATFGHFNVHNYDGEELKNIVKAVPAILAAGSAERCVPTDEELATQRMVLTGKRPLEGVSFGSFNFVKRGTPRGLVRPVFIHSFFLAHSGPRKA